MPENTDRQPFKNMNTNIWIDVTQNALQCGSLVRTLQLFADAWQHFIPKLQAIFDLFIEVAISAITLREQI